YYVNDFPHIGHAYTSIAADVIARFKRLDGFKVHFLTGTDEHGQKIQKSAEKANIETQKFVDSFAANFQKLSQQLNLSNDDFIRTTEERHIRFVKKVWQTLYDKGYIYLAKYSGWYAVRDEAFYQEA
ncbi:MAG: class I tRNA ligase family protein, partial [Candidatus Midichloria sp.]|nr:class I tRNA ligase family protein [Candidatus Midichloria sp.]